MRQNTAGDANCEAPAAIPNSPALLNDPPPEVPLGGRHDNLSHAPPRRGKPLSPKTQAVRRAIEALGGPAADTHQVIDRLRQEGVEASAQDVANQKAALKRLADEPRVAPPAPADVTLTAQDVRDFTALLRRVGVEGVRALLEMAEALR
jgi:hypothetical protein